ncbi:MAG: peptidoglycan-binding domain-containing protein [Candidatus Omnitrophota bacterium]|nr:peptidoglycan-binding domain-containing protein [Candidatus Omnitrophota bacterium]
MGIVRIGLIGMVVVGLSGCAAGKTSQEVKRLQSHIGLLDQRVSQLERAGGTWQASEILPEPVIGPGPTAAILPQPTTGTSKNVGAAVKPSTRDIQQALKNSGFYQGSVDGKMGPLTKSAIKEFQRVHGLKDDGVVGKQTWAQMSTYANLSSGSPEAITGEVVK